MQHPNGVPSVATHDTTAGKDRLELIQFSSAEAQRQAITALVDSGMLNFTSYRDREWFVRTAVARRLRELGVGFEWLTENA